MSDTRIINLIEKESLEEGDYIAVDNYNGTRKLDIFNEIGAPLSNIGNPDSSPDKYSSTRAYKVSDLTIHNDILYRCKSACSAAVWEINEPHFERTTLTTAHNLLNTFGTLYGKTQLSREIKNHEITAIARFQVSKTGYYILKPCARITCSGNQFISFYIGTNEPQYMPWAYGEGVTRWYGTNCGSGGVVIKYLEKDVIYYIYAASSGENITMEEGAASWIEGIYIHE